MLRRIVVNRDLMMMCRALSLSPPESPDPNSPKRSRYPEAEAYVSSLRRSATVRGADLPQAAAMLLSMFLDSRTAFLTGMVFSSVMPTMRNALTKPATVESAGRLVFRGT